MQIIEDFIFDNIALNEQGLPFCNTIKNGYQYFISCVQEAPERIEMFFEVKKLSDTQARGIWRRYPQVEYKKFDLFRLINNEFQKMTENYDKIYREIADNKIYPG